MGRSSLGGFSQLILLERRFLLELDTAEKGQGPLEALTKALAEAGKRQNRFTAPIPSTSPALYRIRSWESKGGGGFGNPWHTLEGPPGRKNPEQEDDRFERYISELPSRHGPALRGGEPGAQALVKEPLWIPWRYGISEDPYKAIGQADLFHQTTQVYQRERLYEMAAGRSS